MKETKNTNTFEAYTTYTESITVVSPNFVT